MSAAVEHEKKYRLDKWLWAARFFKTRGLAIAAINGGKVHLNDRRVKPSQVVREGDVLAVRKGPYTFEVVVKGLSQRRGPAAVAAELYEETAASRQARETLALELKALRPEGTSPRMRPSKRDRRQIIRFTRRDS
jgi:ribosome-associated heat shock protein Hsp15